MELELFYENLTEDKRGEAAQALHERILGDANRVAYALCDLAEHLKIMRDTKLYVNLGMGSFEEYVESRVGIKQRQAYNYISAYERLGRKVMAENAGLGITKLNLLAEVSGTDRADFMEAHDLDGMTVQEVRELVQKTKDQGEQLGILQAALDEAKNREEGLQKLADGRKEELEKLKTQPTEVAVQEVSEADREKIRAEVGAEFEKKQESAKKRLEKSERESEQLRQELEQAKAAAEELAEQKAGELVSQAKAQAEKEKQEILERTRRDAAQINASADGEIREANVLFGLWQEAHGKLMDKLREIAGHDREKAMKLWGLAVQVARGMAEAEL